MKILKPATKASPFITKDFVTPVKQRNTTLDVIRGIAITMVLLHHAAIVEKSAVPGFPFKQIRLFLCSFTIGGWSGVDLFFVLSGFLVSGLLFKEYNEQRTINAGRFLIRRFFKIFPSFAVFILLTFLIEQPLQLGLQSGFSSIDYVKDLFFLNNYLGGRWITTWSLDVEEAFYLLLPVFFIFIIARKNMKARTFLVAYILLCVCGIAFRIKSNLEHPAYSFELHYIKTHFRLDALFFGVFLSYLYNYKQEELKVFLRKYRVVIVACSALFLLPNFFIRRDDYNWVSVVLLATNPIFYGGLIIMAIEFGGVLFKNRFIALVGRNSYAIYLWHAFVNLYMIKYLYSGSVASYFTYLFTYLAVSIIVGIIMTRLIETPFLRLRERLFGKKRQPQMVNSELVLKN
ncbi:Peptidoglycan/LPS O-acetylase OafA/YrhL, contains acyltransferase and SGNH-hydrolase domains [Filimonas lacunae]|uniref:Peptidoglycan/LPS O-acetylase OafA/YrhL, contains acyltransferase and SGNH-hydrolase domains n=1 Tax=Filimonas lacunae TaxID=477680 RepID=A0A173MPG3_9BACT|nr:acyltransferase [Filimonas lacunae]BAV09532.1 lipopolysaccharide modification acyltransferase [Filimonas lacunae]SIS74750.1 Peptidoglycan/LPS O-acetylase OafA/YrhL, contains acyltransferase and SGNH-hydrolase domains [Filimonas lacunae]